MLTWGRLSSLPLESAGWKACPTKQEEAITEAILPLPAVPHERNSGSRSNVPAKAVWLGRPSQSSNTVV